MVDGDEGIRYEQCCNPVCSARYFSGRPGLKVGYRASPFLPAKSVERQPVSLLSQLICVLLLSGEKRSGVQRAPPISRQHLICGIVDQSMFEGVLNFRE